MRCRGFVRTFLPPDRPRRLRSHAGGMPRSTPRFRLGPDPKQQWPGSDPRPVEPTGLLHQPANCGRGRWSGQLVPLGGGGEPHLPGEFGRLNAKGGERAFGQIHDHLPAHTRGTLALASRRSKLGLSARAMPWPSFRLRSRTSPAGHGDVSIFYLPSSCFRFLQLLDVNSSTETFDGPEKSTGP